VRGASDFAGTQVSAIAVDSHFSSKLQRPPQGMGSHRPVLRLHAEPGLQGVKQSPFARRTPEAVAAIPVLIAAFATTPAAAPAQPWRVIPNTATTARSFMANILARPDMFFDLAAF
jgi:hypothetical protein